MRNYEHTLPDELVVIKVGTSTLTRVDTTGDRVLDAAAFGRIGAQVTELIEQDAAVAVVSSAAIAAGAMQTGETYNIQEYDIVEKQRLACLGQIALLQAWQTALRPRHIGQLLFTKQELFTPEQSELQRVALRLIARKDIPVANENDALSYAEITFGDNDILAAHFASLLHASGKFKNTKLLMLSDVDGVYAERGNTHTHIPTIEDIDAYAHLAHGPETTCGSGGMASKFQAARIAHDAGIETCIANGRTEQVIQKALGRIAGTWFTCQ